MTLPVEPEQHAIVEAIESGAASGEAARLRRVDTHMSHVFLGRDRVFKLKRSLRHAFADMSTPALRRAACEAELAVNQALAPRLYEAVLPVNVGSNGAVVIGGPGETLDWVVAMRRFDDGALLEEIAEKGRLSPAMVLEAVRAVCDFHRAQPAREDTGHAADYRRVIAGLRRTEADGAAQIGARSASDALFEALDHEVVRLAPLIEARRRDGWVRRGHGDLHLRNLCIFEGRVTPFDALEFDPALATTDVLYDLAFLLMDLRARGLGAHVNAAMNQYWDTLEQPEGALALLPLFMALRAGVRMAVAVAAGELAQAADYRNLAWTLLKPPRAALVAIGGLSGTGKSTLAARLAPGLGGPCGARVLRSDVIRKQIAAVGASDRLSDAAYAPGARALVYDALVERARAALAAGAPGVADATFQSPASRAAIEAAAGTHSFVGLWLRASAATRVQRIGTRTNDASDATAQVALAQEEPDTLGPTWRILDAGKDPGQLAEDAGQVLGLSVSSAAPAAS